MKKSIIGGFVVRELPREVSKRDEIAKCSKCQRYSTQSKMDIINNRYKCKGGC